MTVRQELVSELETLSPKEKMTVLRFCKLLQNPVFMKEYEREKAKHGGAYPPDLLEALMDHFEGGAMLKTITICLPEEAREAELIRRFAAALLPGTKVKVCVTDTEKGRMPNGSAVEVDLPAWI